MHICIAYGRADAGLQRVTSTYMKGVGKKGEIGGKMKNGENGVEVGMWGMGCVDKLGYSG